MKNWKTTVLGTGAILSAAGHLLTSIGTGDVSGTTLTLDAGIILSGMQGIFAKDYNVTGGNVKQVLPPS